MTPADAAPVPCSRINRCGNSVIIRIRSSSVYRDQAVISARVRPQPTHNADTLSTVQMLLHGLLMSAMASFGEGGGEIKHRGGERNHRHLILVRSPGFALLYPDPVQ